MVLQQIDEKILSLAKQSDKDLESIYKRIDNICMVNSNRILSAFIENKVSYTDFADINGYGNYDTGRDKLEAIFSKVLGTEDAIVRPDCNTKVHSFVASSNNWISYLVCDLW